MIGARHPRQEDQAHLAFVRTQPCCVCKHFGPSEAAHIRMACSARGKRPTGMQEKPDDKWSTPLCPYHHRIGIGSQHSMGEADFWIMVGLDPFAIALELWKRSGGEARVALPQAVKPPRPIKARKPREKRAKIGSGRKLQSNPVIQSRGFDKRPRPLTYI